MRLLSLLVFLFTTTSVFGDMHFSCCNRTPKYIIAASTALGAGAGALAGYAARNACCRSNRECHCQQSCSCHGKKETSEVLNSLQLMPPEDNSITGPLITVTLFDPCQKVSQQVTMGRGNLPALDPLGGKNNPTEIGKWTAVFTVSADGTLPSDFGGIVVNGTPLMTIRCNPPLVGEQQQICFVYPIH